MKRLTLLITTLLLLTVGVSAQTTSQRVVFTSSNPPTVCAPGKLYSNATTHKIYQGSSVGGCTDVTGGGGGISGLTTNTIPKATSATTIGDSRITENAATNTTTFSAATVNPKIHIGLGTGTIDPAQQFAYTKTLTNAGETDLLGVKFVVYGDATEVDRASFATTLTTNTGVSQELIVSDNSVTTGEVFTAAPDGNIFYEATSLNQVVWSFDPLAAGNDKHFYFNAISGGDPTIFALKKAGVTIFDFDETGGITGVGAITVTTPNGFIASGTPTNDAAAAGFIGEYATASLASGSATSLTTVTAKTIISVSLTAGDWDVTGSVQYIPAATTTTAYVQQGISTTNNTLGGEGTFTSSSGGNLSGTVLGSLISENVPVVRLSLAATTTVYLVAKASFAVSTETGYGTIRARRVR